MSDKEKLITCFNDLGIKILVAEGIRDRDIVVIDCEEGLGTVKFIFNSQGKMLTYTGELNQTQLFERLKK